MESASRFSGPCMGTRNGDSSMMNSSVPLKGEAKVRESNELSRESEGGSSGHLISGWALSYVTALSMGPEPLQSRRRMSTRNEELHIGTEHREPTCIGSVTHYGVMPPRNSRSWCIFEQTCR